VSSSRNAPYEARGSAENALEAAQTHSRETNIECGAVVKPRCDKGVDKSSSSSGSERARDDTYIADATGSGSRMYVCNFQVGFSVVWGNCPSWEGEIVQG